jgi:two-component system CheB/CheR fusion protein
VIKTLIPIKVEVETDKGLWYMMKILPYRTLLNVIDGVSISFNNITELKKTSNMYQNACLYAQSIVETVKEPLFVLDSDKNVISANRSFYEFFKVDKKETLGVSIYKLGNAQWAVPKFKKLLEEMLADKTSIKDFEITHVFSEIGKKKILINANKVFHEKEMILISLFETI